MAHLTDGLDIALFDGLSLEDIDRFLALATRRSFQNDEVIIAEGDPGHTLFIVVSGWVRVEKATIEQKQELLTSLGPGECIGELSLVDREPRSATVRAVGKTDVYVLGSDDLDAFWASYPQVHSQILENLVKITSRRLRQLDETLAQGMYDAVITVDASFRMRNWKRITDKPCLLEGLTTSSEAAGRDLFEVVLQLGEGVRQKLSQVMASGKTVTLPLEYEIADGSTAYFELTIAPYSEGREISGAALGIRNVTDTKSLEIRLIQAEKLAMAGQMAAEIGHELKNYLTVIVGHTDLLLANTALQALEKASRSVQVISDQLGRIERFASGMMDLGMLRSKTETSDLNLLAEKLIQFIQGQSRFRRIELVLDLHPSLPLLNVDPGQIQQVLLNLYTNAADAMGQGRVTTTSHFRKETAQAVLTVEDNGPGMPEDMRDLIFNAGFTTKETGHGFGLAICRRIVENHNGTIEVASEPGVGTTFTLTFPVQR